MKKRSNYNKTSCFEEIKITTEDTKVKHTNSTTQLKWKLFTKVIKGAKIIGLGSYRQRVYLKEKRKLKLKVVQRMFCRSEYQ